MIQSSRICATCVFWSPRGERGGQSSGRCRGSLLAGGDPRAVNWTQADFVCGQWCGHVQADQAPPSQAAE